MGAFVCGMRDLVSLVTCRVKFQCGDPPVSGFWGHMDSFLQVFRVRGGLKKKLADLFLFCY